jgi:hypothetical protein
MIPAHGELVEPCELLRLCGEYSQRTFLVAA